MDKLNSNNINSNLIRTFSEFKFSDRKNVHSTLFAFKDFLLEKVKKSSDVSSDEIIIKSIQIIEEIGRSDDEKLKNLTADILFTGLAENKEIVKLARTIFTGWALKNLEDVIEYFKMNNVLLEKFPEFKSSVQYKDCDQELIYPVYFAFSEFLTERIEKSFNSESDELIMKAFKFFDEMGNSSNRYIATLVVVQIFEDLIQNEKSIDLGKKFFTSESQKDFKAVMKHFEIKKIK